MRTTRARWNAAVVAIFGLIVTAGVAEAQSKKVVKAMKGSLIVTDDALAMPDGDDKSVIKALKKASQTSVKHFMSDGVANWQFNFLAFMKKSPRVTELSLDFYTDDKEKLYVANKKLSGIDKKLRILQTRVEISEDENVTKGRKYIIKLVATRGNKETVLASTKLLLK